MVEGHANDVLEMREKVEDIWSSSDSKRVRRSRATEGAPGYSLFAVNVGTFNNILNNTPIYTQYISRQGY